MADMICHKVYELLMSILMNNNIVKAVIEFGFCDIPNDQGLDKCYQSRLQLDK
jgi:hypothetical protein